MSYNVAQIGRFLNWGENDGTVLISAALTSANDLSGGVVTGAGAGSVTYSANGVLLNSTASINWLTSLTAGQISALLGGFTMTCWVESSFIDQGYVGGTGGEYLMGGWSSGTSYFSAVKGQGAQVLQLRSAGTISTTSSTLQKANAHGSFVRIDMVYKGGSLTELYVDLVPVAVLAAGAPTTTPFSAFIGVGGSTVGVGLQTYRIKNFMLRSIPSQLTVFPQYSHIAMFGHSFAAKGDYAAANSYIVGSGSAGTPTPYDDRTCTFIHQQLASHGIAVGTTVNSGGIVPNGRILNYGISSTTVAQLATQITTATASGQKLRTVMVQSGINDALGGTPASQSAWQTQIDSFVAAGATKIFIANMTSPVNDTSPTDYSTATYKGYIDTGNASIKAVVAANPTTCVLVDLFSAFGGHNINPSDFLTNDIHPSVPQGHQKIGKAFANALLANL